MKGRNQRALLMEIMIAVLFFALCATVLLEVFAAARTLGERAERDSQAMLEMQDLAERLYASEDAQALLAADGFEQDGDVWTLERNGYRLEAALSVTQTDAGALREAWISARDGEELLGEIESARYLPGEAAQ